MAKSFRAAVAAALLAASIAVPSAAQAAPPLAGISSHGPLSLLYRMQWLAEFLGLKEPVYSCQHRADCGA